MLSKLPSRFIDVSALRVIPDHQEVFVHTWSAGEDTTGNNVSRSNVDVSIIIELLSMDMEALSDSDTSLVRHHFNDLASSNEALESTVYSEGLISRSDFIPHLSGRSHEVYALAGRQRISKYRTRPNSAVDNVYVFLVLIRLPDVSTDVLVSMNLPIDTTDEAILHELHSQYLHIEVLVDHHHESNSSFPQQSVDSHLVSTSHLFAESIEAYTDFIRSLNIIDWGLFQ